MQSQVTHLQYRRPAAIIYPVLRDKRLTLLLSHSGVVKYAPRSFHYTKLWWRIWELTVECNNNSTVHYMCDVMWHNLIPKLLPVNSLWVVSTYTMCTTLPWTQDMNQNMQRTPSLCFSILAKVHLSAVFESELRQKWRHGMLETCIS